MPRYARKLKCLCFGMFALFPNLSPELIPRIFDLFSSRKLGWNFSYEPKAKFIPVTEPAGQPGSYEEPLYQQKCGVWGKFPSMCHKSNKDEPSSETQGQSVGSGEKARRKFSSTDWLPLGLRGWGEQARYFYSERKLACEAQTYFRSSLLSLRKITEGEKRPPEIRLRFAG